MPYFRVLIPICSIFFSLYALASSPFQSSYIGQVTVTAPGFDVSDTCNVEISVHSAADKITIERHAKKCDKYKLKQKNQKFEFAISGETLSYKGKTVGSLKSGILSAEFNIEDVYVYQLSASILENQNLQYSETLIDTFGFTSEVEMSVEGVLSPKK